MLFQQAGQLIMDSVGHPGIHAEQYRSRESLGSLELEDEGAKPPVPRNEDAVQLAGRSEEVRVGRAAEPSLGGREDVVAQRTEKRYRGVIDVLIDEKTRRGPSGCGNVDLFGLDESRRVFDAGLHVIHREIWIVTIHDLLEWNPVLNQFEDAVDRNAGPFDTGLAEMDRGVYNDLLTVHHGSPPPLDFTCASFCKAEALPSRDMDHAR